MRTIVRVAVAARRWAVVPMPGVPVLGWFVNVVLVVLGVGGMTLAIFERPRGGMRRRMGRRQARPAAGRDR